MARVLMLAGFLGLYAPAWCNAGIVFVDQQVSVILLGERSFQPPDFQRTVEAEGLGDINIVESAGSESLLHSTAVAISHHSSFSDNSIVGFGSVNSALHDSVQGANRFHTMGTSTNIVTFLVDSPTHVSLDLHANLDGSTYLNPYVATTGLYFYSYPAQFPYPSIIAKFYADGIVDYHWHGVLVPGQYRALVSLATDLGHDNGFEIGAGSFSYRIVIPESSTAILILFGLAAVIMLSSARTLPPL